MEKKLQNASKFNLEKLKCKPFHTNTFTIKTIAFIAIVFVFSFFNSIKAQCSSVTYAVASNNCGIDYISNVTFATINRTSGCDTYSVYGSPNPNLTMGLTYTLSVTTDGDSEGVRAWIDYNGDGVFNNNVGTELVLGPLYTGNVPETYTAAVTIPFTATVGQTRLRVRCNYASAPTDPTSAQTWGETEDYCVVILPNTPCSTQPSTNTIAAPNNSICPNTGIMLALANNYTVGGLSYQWYSSTQSSVGIFNAIPGATTSSYGTPNLTQNTWYTAEITCANAPGTTTATSGLVMVSPVIVDNVPYHEGFESIQAANTLPNCSWSVSASPVNVQTYVSSNTNGRIPHSGSKFASFYYSPGGTYRFYTNGIQLNAGVTYSAGLWYQTDYYGYNNWTDLSIMYGTTQSATGLITIASSNGPAISNVYKTLSNTFTVATSGVYYVAVKATVNTSQYAYYLTWDDLSITVPCEEGSSNKPTLNLSASSVSICEGQAVNLTVAGADTYTWTNDGSNGNVLTDMPTSNTIYSVIGTNTLTGCTSTIVQAVSVNPSPSVYVVSDKYSVCKGSSAKLTGLGAASYTWSNGVFTTTTAVSPMVATSYTLLGSNSFGCSSQAVQLITVNDLPTIAASSNVSEICLNEVATLNATGGLTYQWMSSTSSILYQGISIAVSPNASTSYTVIGTDANGCSNRASVDLTVNGCVGINKYTASTTDLNVFPNPTSGDLFIETHNTAAKTVEVVDVTGRVVLTSTSSQETIQMNMSSFVNGVYYVKVQSESTTDVVKFVKN